MPKIWLWVLAKFPPRKIHCWTTAAVGDPGERHSKTSFKDNSWRPAVGEILKFWELVYMARKPFQRQTRRIFWVGWLWIIAYQTAEKRMKQQKTLGITTLGGQKCHRCLGKVACLPGERHPPPTKGPGAAGAQPRDGPPAHRFHPAREESGSVAATMTLPELWGEIWRCYWPFDLFEHIWCYVKRSEHIELKNVEQIRLVIEPSAFPEENPEDCYQGTAPNADWGLSFLDSLNCEAFAFSIFIDVYVIFAIGRSEDADQLGVADVGWFLRCTANFFWEHLITLLKTWNKHARLVAGNSKFEGSILPFKARPM